MNRESFRVAIVGGGIFGTTSAIELARRGHRVELFEQKDDLLQAASGINQYRLHRGYHYPRSRETAIDCRDSELVIRDVFRPAVVEGNSNYYVIAAHDSLTTPGDYLAFCRDLRLEHEPGAPVVLRPGSVSLSLRVRESLFDPSRLRSLVWDQLRAAEVEVHLKHEVRIDDLDAFDFVVVATYAGLNRTLNELPSAQRTYQYEVCEKPVVRLPERYARTSVVVMDGPFMCFDPLGQGDTFVLGNVVHAIHTRNIGALPEIPDELAGLLDRGIIERPPITNIDRFIAAAVEFFPDFDQAEHIGSMFTVRAVLPGVEKTDARPTLVRQVNDRVISIFSGKIDTCIAAADQVGRLVDERVLKRA
jgi:hypothetical protein